MGLHSLGIVTSASVVTGARATANEAVPAANYPAQGAHFQAVGDNTDVVYICDTDTPDLVTGEGVLHEIPAPSSSDPDGTRPDWSFDTPGAPSNYNLAEIYILPAVADEGVRVTANQN